MANAVNRSATAARRNEVSELLQNVDVTMAGLYALREQAVTPIKVAGNFAEPRDTTELVSLVDEAANRCADAATVVRQLGYLFEAIKSMTEEWTPVRGLAALGANLSEQDADEFERAKARFSAEVERHG